MPTHVAADAGGAVLLLLNFFWLVLLVAAAPPQLAPGMDISYLQNLLGFRTQPVPADVAQLLGTATNVLQTEAGPIAFSSNVTVATLPPGLSWPDQSNGTLLVSQPPLMSVEDLSSLAPWQTSSVTSMSDFSVALSLPSNVTAIGLYATPVGACTSFNTRITASVFLSSNADVSTSAASDLYSAEGLCSTEDTADAGLQQTRFLAFYVEGLAPGIPLPGSNSSTPLNEDRLVKLEVHLVSDLAGVGMALSFVQMTTSSPGLGGLSGLCSE